MFSKQRYCVCVTMKLASYVYTTVSEYKINPPHLKMGSAKTTSLLLLFNSLKRAFNVDVRLQCRGCESVFRGRESNYRDMRVHPDALRELKETVRLLLEAVSVVKKALRVLVDAVKVITEAVRELVEVS
jgi:hypothetical protein